MVHGGDLLLVSRSLEMYPTGDSRLEVCGIACLSKAKGKASVGHHLLLFFFNIFFWRFFITFSYEKLQLQKRRLRRRRPKKRLIKTRLLDSRRVIFLLLLCGCPTFSLLPGSLDDPGSISKPLRQGLEMKREETRRRSANGCEQELDLLLRAHSGTELDIEE